MNINNKFKILNLIALLIIVFAVSVVVWYSPIVFKGYSVLNVWKSSLLARNLSQSNVFGAENSQNVFLAPSLVKEQAQLSTEGNKLTPIIISWIFSFFGLPKYDNLIFISIVILAFTLMIFTVTVYYLFNLKTAAVFSFVYILLPFNWWYGPYNFGSYEISLLFLSLFFLFFLLGLKSEWKYKYILIILSGLFLALSGLARETMLMLAPVVFFYLLFKKQKKELFYLFVPFFILIFGFWLPDMIQGKNCYLVYFKNQLSQTTQNAQSFLNWDHLCHIFPDPYTYHFNQQNHLDKVRMDIESSNVELITRVKMSKTAVNMGFKSPSLMDRLKIGTTNLIRHLSRFLAIEDIGGPFIFLLLVLGFIYLRKEENYLYRFFVFWVTFSLFFLSFIIMGARTHLIDFGWIIALGVALGILLLTDILSQYFQTDLWTSQKLYCGISIFLTLFVLYNLVLSGHVLWGRVYDEPYHLKSLAYVREINRLDISDEDVIAISLGQFKINKLNYLTGKSMVVFAPDTIEALIEEGKLQDGFDKFGIKYILGYSDRLTGQILKNSNVINVASNSVSTESSQISRTKSWLMNLIR